MDTIYLLWEVTEESNDRLHLISNDLENIKNIKNRLNTIGVLYITREKFNCILGHKNINND